MVSALDAEAGLLIGKVAQKLKGMNIPKPAFVGMVKTGSHCERPPEQEDFWYMRCASILRQAYARDAVGTQRLRRHYGGRRRHRVSPEHAQPAGGSTIRKAMQALEKQGLLEKTKKGRKLTRAGRQLLDSTTKEVRRGPGGA